MLVDDKHESEISAEYYAVTFFLISWKTPRAITNHFSLLISRKELRSPNGLKKDLGKVIHCRRGLRFFFSKQEQFKLALMEPFNNASICLRLSMCTRAASTSGKMDF